MESESTQPRSGAGLPWEKRADGWWLEDPTMDVERMAGFMAGIGARLVTVTGTPIAGGECRLAYHWDLDGAVMTFVTTTREGAIPSIAELCPAADWIEREIRDYFAVEFTGRETLPLVLRAADTPGFFLWGDRRGDP